MDTTIKNMLIGLVILIILTPLGLLATGETFGEWGLEELKEKLGFVPKGLEEQSAIYNAPLPDYAVPGHESGTSLSIGYIASAIIGVVVCAGLLYVVGKSIAKKNGG
jgi:hypothetical protein